MAVYSLAISEDAWQSQVTVLEGVTYDYEVRWNPRDEAWYFRIATTGIDYEMNTKLKVGLDLLKPYTHLESVPDGRLIVVDNERVTGRIGRDDFGIDKRFELLYITKEDEDIFDGLYY